LDSSVTSVTNRPPLVRPRRSVLGGVSAALSTHLGWSVRGVRWLFVLLTVIGGAGVLLYLWLWALVPIESPAAASSTDPNRGLHSDPSADHNADPGVDTDADPATESAIYRRAPMAALLVVVSGIAALTAFGSLGRENEEIATQALFIVTLASGGAVAWSLGFDRNDPSRSPRYQTVTRVLAIAILLVAGAVTLSSRPNAVNAILGVIMLICGVAWFAAPRIVTLWTDLMAERAARVRQEQRAEIAAHLHDSVLQTLALIQNRAGASSEVARIARAQERELRDWLFVGDEPVAADLATELRGVAAAIELDYAVRIEVVTAGETTDLSSPAVVAAAREAMLNAARHAGGDVSVYIETSARSIDVFIRDRGPGVNLADLPTDRLGIRESIIGRMTRAGGTASVRPGAGGAPDGGTGTEVHLHLEVSHD
jgi:signal transduction histidine kinase/phage shock protein PspC (stress-responsive transcriptional regulator)